MRFQLHSAVRPLVFLAGVVLLAYMQRASVLGLHSDDVFLRELAIRHSSDILSAASDFSLDYAGNGRPLAQFLLLTLYYLGDKIYPVTGLYVLSAFLLWLQSAVSFLVFRRFAPAPLAALAAALQILFPADAARFLPVHAFQSQIVAICFWTSAYLMTSRRPLIAACVMASTLLIYETHWLIGLSLPLLLVVMDPTKSGARGALMALLQYVAAAIPIVLWRMSAAPGRASEQFADASAVASITRIFEAIRAGIEVSIASLWERPMDTLRVGDAAAWTAGACALTIAILALWAKAPPREEVSGELDASVLVRRRVVLLSFGAAALLLVYPLFGLYPARFPPAQFEGRLSSVHNPAGIGLSTICLVLALHVLSTAPAKIGAAFKVLLAGYVAVLVGFASVNQKRYADSWAYQQRVWQIVSDNIASPAETALVVLEGCDAVNTSFEQRPFDWVVPYLARYVQWRRPSSDVLRPTFICAEQVRSNGRFEGDRLIIEGLPTLPSKSYRLEEIENFVLSGGRVFRGVTDKAYLSRLRE